MDSSDGFFFSFDAPRDGGHVDNAARAPQWPQATCSTAQFPWVALTPDTVNTWAAAYCVSPAGSGSRSSGAACATKPLRLEASIPRAVLTSAPAIASTASPSAESELVTMVLCHQTPPEVSELTAVARTEHRDVIPGRYYGGLKVWSCATLLAEYLAEHAMGYQALLAAADTVVELGCGQGLPGMVALCLGARRVVFQDYNAEVLEVCTRPNVAATVKANAAAFTQLRSSSEAHAQSQQQQVKFVHGDWVDLAWEGAETRAGTTCDVVLGADVTFDKEACDKLACVLRRWLRPRTGVALIVTKDYYFGTNGGYLEFARSAAANGLRLTVLTRVDTADKMPHVVLRVTTEV